MRHWVSMECYRKGELLSILKILKKKARGFPSHAQGKEIDSGIVAYLLICFTCTKVRLFVFYNLLKEKYICNTDCMYAHTALFTQLALKK